jgi:DNA polymerase-3 subunit delta
MTTYTELRKQLDGNNIANLYLLMGPEDYLGRQLISLITNAALGDGMRDFNFAELDTPTASPPALLQELNAYPLGTQRRVVLIQDVGSLPAESEKALRESVSNLPDFLTVILTAERLDRRKVLFKEIAKAGVVVELRPLKPAEVKTWIRHRLRDRGKKIPHQLTEHIFELTGAALSDVSNEIENLVAYMGDRTEVEQSDIEALVASRNREPIYKLSEHIADREFLPSCTVLKQLLAEGEHQLRILWHLDFMVKKLLRAKCMLEEGVTEDVITRNLQIQSFRRRRFMQQVRSFSLDELRKMYRTIVEWDNKFKSTSRWHPDIDMELLVRELCVTQER